jgi:hypothetical protein
MNTVFYHFKRKGVEFLLIPNGSNCSICDIEGNNYGSYMDVKSFEYMAEKEGGFEKLRLGRIQIQFMPVR